MSASLAERAGGHLCGLPPAALPHRAAGKAYFWRDNIGNEVDLLIERGGVLHPVEFKSGATCQPAWLQGLHTWQRHAAQTRQAEPLLICGAPGNQRLQGVGVAHWRDALLALAGA